MLMVSGHASVYRGSSWEPTTLPAHQTCKAQEISDFHKNWTSARVTPKIMTLVHSWIQLRNHEMYQSNAINMRVFPIETKKPLHPILTFSRKQRIPDETCSSSLPTLSRKCPTVANKCTLTSVGGMKDVPTCLHEVQTRCLHVNLWGKPLLPADNNRQSRIGAATPLNVRVERNRETHREIDRSARTPVFEGCQVISFGCLLLFVISSCSHTHQRDAQSALLI